MARVKMELRNVPRFRVIEYLVEAGGQLIDDLHVEGENWEARLEAMEPAWVGSFRVRRDCLVIEGHEAAVEPVKDHMRQRTMRGGG